MVLTLKDKISSVLKNVNKNIKTTSTTFKNSFAKSLDSANTQADKMLKSINKISKALAGIGTVTVGAVVGTGLKDFTGLEKQLAQTASTGGFDKLSEEYKTIQKLSERLGRETSKTAEEVAAAMEKMYLAGWDTNDVSSTIEDLIKFSIANNEDLTNVVDLVTDSTGAIGLEIEDLSDFMDKLTKASTKANATVSQFLESTLKSGAGLSTINTSMEEMLALQGILANSGFKGSESGTSLNSLSNRLYKSSGEGARGLQMLGVSAFNSDETVKSFDTLMKDIASSIQGKSETQITESFSYLFGEYKAQGLALVKSFSDMQGGNEQLTNALMSIASDMALEDSEIDLNKIKEIQSSYYELLNEIKNNSDGAVKTKYDIQTDTLDQDLSSLKSAFSGFSVAFAKAFGENARPLIQKFTQSLNNLSGSAEKISENIVEKIKKIFKVIKANKDSILNIAAAVGLFLGSFITVTKVAKSLNKLKSNFQGVSTVLTALKTSGGLNFFSKLKNLIVAHGPAVLNTIESFEISFRSIFKLFEGGISKGVRVFFGLFKNFAMANPILVIAIALGGLVFGIIKLYQNSKEFRNKVHSIFENLKTRFTDFGQRFMGIYNDKIKPCWEKIKSCFVDGKGDVLGIWSNLLGGILDVLDWAVGFLLNTISTLIEFVIDIASSFVSIFTGLIDFFVGVFTLDWSRAWDGIKSIFSGVVDFIMSWVDLIKNALFDLGQSIKDAWTKVKGWFGKGKDVEYKANVSYTSDHLRMDNIKIPKNALGTSYFSGGLTTINERGGELVSLRSGAKIIPGDKTDKLFDNIGKNIVLNINIDGNVIGDDDYVNKIGTIMLNKIKKMIPNTI